MRRRRRKTGPDDVRRTAQQLIDLALDEGTTIDERRTAAMQAVKFIDRHDLLSRPFEGNETVQAALNIAETLTGSDLANNVKKIFDEAKRRSGR
jgi:hypothetical protein